MVKTIIKIEGMMCGMCESHINAAIRKHFDVKKVKSSHKKGQTVVVSYEKIDLKALKKVIDETGYILISVNQNEEG
ncbi:heavy metal-associated domain-containing protein [Faecalicoccus pleomorphus]|uniref:heavy-metal-associated domain-containing protein n=1 Tax=Faecalicoccus pleomorphus TaxID=1323 RepID=UPI00232F2BB5|nr:heavy metal-associated domain-containing protein [Faecalicoccus pleomorphus]MDB7986603.1 heavy metal-associated domain-containing protein [Faecalicoccus pleomorphus]MDB7990656.1 heavy metal-associated domain-containing protein [Faecalicoccus pleomorphus]